MNARKERAPRLGRGLAALLGDRDEAAGAGPSSLPIEKIAPGPFQPRQAMAPEALAELAQSIRSHGILQPILVRADPDHTGHFQIVAGERRWRAAQMAELHEVPVHVRDLDDHAALAAALIENLQRQDLNAIEEAEGLRRLSLDFGLTQDMLANSVGKSRSHVANTLRLLGLPEAVQADVRQGRLSAGHARALLGHSDPTRAALTVVARGLNVRQTEALSKPNHRRPTQSVPSAATFDVTALEARLTAALGLRTKISFDGVGGQIELAYRSLDQLEGLLRLLDPAIAV